MSIKAESVQFAYGAKKILDDISAQFERGHLYGILGPNGSGKTTFLKVLSGLLRAHYGQVTIDNLDLQKLAPQDIAKRVAVVPDTTAVVFDFAVEEIVAMGRYVYVGRLARETPEDKLIVETLLHQFNLAPLRTRRFNELSAGERQKVIIARAIAQQSKIILLDEPTTHLDINYQVEFMEMLKKYVADGLVVVTILHDLNLAAQYCDNVFLISRGKLHAFGTPEAVLTRLNVKQVYNVDVAVRKNAFTHSIYLTPIAPHATGSKDIETNGKIKRIHVVCGGGTGQDLLPSLRGNDVSIGVVNVLDDDFVLATDLNYEIISEAPFCPVSEKSRNELIQKLRQTDAVVVTNLPYGRGNIENLTALETCLVPLILVEKTPIEERDFTNGRAAEIYRRIRDKPNVTVVKTVPAIIGAINQTSTTRAPGEGQA